MFSGIDHVGVVVRDLSTMAAVIGDVFELPRTRELSLPDLGMRAAFFAAPGFDLEVIQVDDPETRQIRLGDGPARIEHVALKVQDVRECARKLGMRGVRFTAGAGSARETHEPLAVGGTLSLFTQPETTGGVVFQIIEGT